MDRLATELNLNDDQKAKIKAIFEDARPQVQTIRQDTSLSPQDKMAKLKALHDASYEKIKQLLAPDQQQKLDQIHDRMKQQSAAAPNPPPNPQSSPPPPPNPPQ